MWMGGDSGQKKGTIETVENGTTEMVGKESCRDKDVEREERGNRIVLLWKLCRERDQLERKGKTGEWPR